MANIKISELNEATTVNNDDLLVIVDVTNDETKKVKANLVGGNIPIQSTAPVEPQENDLWIDNSEINTGTLKFYKDDIWKIVDGQITGDTLPIGAIMPYPSAIAPTNWLTCDGSAVSRTTYSDLFAIVGTTFGSGDGVTTFNLPNLKGKVVVGQDTSDADFDVVGETGGEKTHTLTTNEIPSHTHNVKVTNSGASGTQIDSPVSYSSSGTDKDVSSTGGGQAHNNLQPYQVHNYIIKARQSRGLVGNILTETSSSTTDSYACSYINNKLDKTSVKTSTTDSSTDTYSCTYINGIVESGSNSNGSYVKYIDGTMICYGNLLQSPTTEASSGWFDVTLPATFIDTNYRTTVNNTYNYFIDIFWTVGTQTTTSQHLHWTRVGGNIPTSQEVGCQWIAIGKWK